MQYRNFLRRFAKQFSLAAPGMDRRIRRAAEMEALEVRRLFAVYNLAAVPPLTFQEGSTANLITVATFASDAPAGDLSAVINLGSVGSPSTDTGQILTSGSEFIPGIGTEPEYSVVTTNVTIGASTGASQQQYSVQVTDTTTGTSPALAIGSIQVLVAPLTAGAAVPTTTVAEGFVVLPSAQLFDFTDGYAGATTADFIPTVDWGDGTPTSTGVVGQFGPGSFFVSSGGHTYDKVGSFNIKITVQDIEFGGSTIESESGAITVTDAALSNGMPSTVTGVEGRALNNVLLGTFQDADPDATAADFTAGITWGDGSPVNDGVVSLIGATSTNTTFAVYGSHEYAAGGVYAFSVAVNDKDGSTLTPSIDGSATISGLSAGTSVPQTGNSGIPLSANDVGSFTDGNAAAPISDFTATIDWGDGSPKSAGVIAQPGAMGTSFVVEGNHTYANPGVYQVSTHVVGDGTTTSLNTSFTITDLPVTGSTRNFTAVEGKNTGQFVLATFEDPNTLATLTGVNAKLAVGGWGDGTPSGAGVQLAIQQTGVDPSNGDPTFEVLGSHTYAEHTAAGVPDTLSVIVTTLGGVSTTLTSPSGGGVTVLDAALSGSAGNRITGVEGNTTGTVLLGTFVDENQDAVGADYTTGGGSVVVNWGDGSAPQTLAVGSLTAIGSPNGVEWAINAAHTYAEEGTFAYTITVSDNGGASTLVSGSAVIADAALTAGPATHLTPSTGTALPGSTVVAIFTDANPLAPATDFTATIDWGDGTSRSTGVIVQPGAVGSAFDVEGGHSYAKAGVYTTLVTVHDAGGSQVVITGSATVTTPAPPTNIVAAPVLSPVDTIVAGANTGAIAVATFTDAGAESAGHYAATITWGDGHTSSGSITVSGSTFTVKGSNTYAAAGEYSPKVTLQKDSLASKSVTDTNRIDVLVTAHIATDGGVTFTGLEGRTVSPTLANFTSVNTTNPASDFSASINWGDGTASSVGTVVSTGGGHFHIVGTHVYDEEATYTATITLKDTFGETTVIKSTAQIADAPLELPTGKTLTVVRGSSFTNLVIGTFRDDDAVNTNPAVYTGTVNWGDGSSTSAAKFVLTGATANLGSFWNVEGTHKYATAKMYTVTISIHDVDSPGNNILITTKITAT